MSDLVKNTNCWFSHEQLVSDRSLKLQLGEFQEIPELANIKKATS